MLSFYLISALISSTLMVHVAVNVLLDYPKRPGAWAFAGFLGGSAAYVLQHSLPAGSVPNSFVYGLFLLNETVPWFLWIFARSICAAEFAISYCGSQLLLPFWSCFWSVPHSWA